MSSLGMIQVNAPDFIQSPDLVTFYEENFSSGSNPCCKGFFCSSASEMFSSVGSQLLHRNRIQYLLISIYPCLLLAKSLCWKQ